MCLKLSFENPRTKNMALHKILPKWKELIKVREVFFSPFCCCLPGLLSFEPLQCTSLSVSSDEHVISCSAT